MSLGLVGIKCGMTGFFEDSGVFVPVSVVKIFNNYIIDIKTLSRDGYSAIKVASVYIKKKRLSKSLSAIYEKLNINYCRYINEFRVPEEIARNYSIGEKLDVNLLNSIKYVNVCGISKGKGFAGVIKRHNFSAQRASHGNSLSHRVPGSIGQCQSPGRVFIGKKLPGRLGGKRHTVKNLKIVKIYTDKGVLFLKGAIPGFVGAKVILKSVIV